MSHKKILLVVTKSNWGGAQRYAYDLATHLPKEEFLPVVLAGGAEGTAKKGVLFEKLEAAHIPTIYLTQLVRDFGSLDMNAFWSIFYAIRNEKPDVVHLNSSKAAALGALAARMLGVRRIIFTVHGWPFNEKRNELVRVLIYLISWFTAFLSHAVIVVSKSDEAQGKKMRWAAEKIRYIPIGIESVAYLSPDEARAALSIYGFTKPIYSLVTIAELTRNKGIRYAIEAIGGLKRRGVKMSYYIIGDGELRTELEDLVREEDVADRVHFLGFVEDAGRYLRAFDMFLLPSIKEGMPYVLLEAAAASLPIVTTTVVNPAFIESYSRTKAVPAADPEALAAALVETMRERMEKEPLPAQNHFPLADMLERTIELY